MNDPRPLAGRFRFLRRLEGRPTAAIWFAVDDMTGVPVVASLLPLTRVVGLEPAIGFEHPRLAPVIDVVYQPSPGELPGGPSIDRQYAVVVAQHFTGVTLQDEIDRGPIEPRRAVELVAQVAAAVSALHERGAIHGAISPRAILVQRDDPRAAVPLLTHAAVAADGAYASPERAGGAGASAPDDAWALHAVLFAALTGHAPFPAESEAALVQRLASMRPPPIAQAGVDDDQLQDILDRGLSAKSTSRSWRVTDLEADLFIWLGAFGSIRPSARKSLGAPPSFDAASGPATVQDVAPPSFAEERASARPTNRGGEPARSANVPKVPASDAPRPTVRSESEPPPRVTARPTVPTRGDEPKSSPTLEPTPASLRLSNRGSSPSRGASTSEAPRAPVSPTLDVTGAAVVAQRRAEQADGIRAKSTVPMATQPSLGSSVPPELRELATETASPSLPRASSGAARGTVALYSDASSGPSSAPSVPSVPRISEAAPAAFDTLSLDPGAVGAPRSLGHRLVPAPADADKVRGTLPLGGRASLAYGPGDELEIVGVASELQPASATYELEEIGPGSVEAHEAAPPIEALAVEPPAPAGQPLGAFVDTSAAWGLDMPPLPAVQPHAAPPTPLGAAATAIAFDVPDDAEGAVVPSEDVARYVAMLDDGDEETTKLAGDDPSSASLFGGFASDPSVEIARAIAAATSSMPPAPEAGPIAGEAGVGLASNPPPHEVGAMAATASFGPLPSFETHSSAPPAQLEIPSDLASVLEPEDGSARPVDVLARVSSSPPLAMAATMAFPPPPFEPPANVVTPPVVAPAPVVPASVAPAAPALAAPVAAPVAAPAGTSKQTVAVAVLATATFVFVLAVAAIVALRVLAARRADSAPDPTTPAASAAPAAPEAPTAPPERTRHPSPVRPSRSSGAGAPPAN